MMRQLAALASLAALLLPMMSAPLPSSWVGAGHGQVIYLNWTDRSGRLAGTAQVTSTSGEAPGMAVSSRQVQLSGTEAHGKVTLRFGGLLLGTTAAGSLSSNRLALEWSSPDGVATDRFTPGDGKAYNRAVSRLKARVAMANTRALKRQEAAAVVRIFRALPGAIHAVEDDQRATRASMVALTAAWDAQRAASPVTTASCFTTDDYTTASTAYDNIADPLLAAQAATTEFSADVEALGMTPAGLNGHKRSSFTAAQRALLHKAEAFSISAGKASGSATASVAQLKKQSDDLINSVAAVPAC